MRRCEVRAAAKAAGQTRYFLSTACRNGHVSERLTCNGQCIECKKHIERTPVHRAAVNTRRIRAYRNDPTAWLLYNAKARAKVSGVPFTLTKSDIVVPEFCPVFGTRLATGQGKVGPNSPTLDRFRPELGYVRGNVAVVSQRANVIKNDASADELRAVARWMDARELV